MLCYAMLCYAKELITNTGSIGSGKRSYLGFIQVNLCKHKQRMSKSVKLFSRVNLVGQGQVSA